MNFYKRNLGAYAKKTAHLSLTEHGAYQVLLDAYYATEHSLPNDKQALYRIAGAFTAGEKRAVDKVADEFFPLNGDSTRHNKRADEELGEYKARASLSRSVGKLGGNPYWEQQYEHPGYLYAARIDDERVKVGITKDWKQRKHGLARTYKTQLSLIKLCRVKCMGVAEEAVLDRFKSIATGEVLRLPADRDGELLAVMAEYDQPTGLDGNEPKASPNTELRSTPSSKTKSKEGAAPPPDLWTEGAQVLAASGMSTESARNFIGKALKHWPADTVLDALRESRGTADPKAYAVKLLQSKPKKAGSGPDPTAGAV